MQNAGKAHVLFSIYQKFLKKHKDVSTNAPVYWFSLKNLFKISNTFCKYREQFIILTLKKNRK